MNGSYRMWGKNIIKVGGSSTESTIARNKYRVRSALIIAAGIVVAVSMSLTSAWTGATSTPPGGNVDPPINVGTTAQTKSGSLGVDAFLAASNASFLGNVGIGTASPGNLLTVHQSAYSQASDAATYGMSLNVSNLQQISLGSDASYQYLQSWQNKPLYINSQGNNILIGSGRLGIGTTSPSAKLAIGGTPGTDGIMFPDGTKQTTAASGSASEGGTGCPTIGTITEPGTGTAGAACTDGSKFIGRYAGANYFATAADDSTSTTWSNASTLCSNLNRHGHTDWFLPSLAVLQMMYENRTQIGSFSAAYYWSSSGYYSLGGNAWFIDFTNGDQFNSDTNDVNRVRCARRS